MLHPGERAMGTLSLIQENKLINLDKKDVIIVVKKKNMNCYAWFKRFPYFNCCIIQLISLLSCQRSDISFPFD